MRVYELAKKHKMKSDELITMLKGFDMEVKNHMSAATDEMVARVGESLIPKTAKKSADTEQPQKKRKSGQLKSNLSDRLALVKARLQKREEMARQKAEMLKNVVSAPERRTDPTRTDATAEAAIEGAAATL